MRRLLPLLLLLIGATAPRRGEVVLLSGTGSACPPEHLTAGALALVLDDAPLPARLEQAQVLAVPAEGEALTRADLARVRGASAVHLVGGTGLGWWRAMTTRGKRSSLQAALLGARARGAALVGWGAGTECLAWACLAPSAELEAGEFRQRNPRRASLEERVVGGLGLTPGGLLIPEGEDALLRALDALHRQRVGAALLLEGELAWRWDANAKRVTLAGSGHAVLIELDGARRQKTGFDHAALSVLQAGDRWDLEGNRLASDGERQVRGEGSGDLKLASLLAAIGGESAPAQVILGGRPGPSLRLEIGHPAKAGSVLRATASANGLPRWPSGAGD